VPPTTVPLRVGSRVGSKIPDPSPGTCRTQISRRNPTHEDVSRLDCFVAASSERDPKSDEQSKHQETEHWTTAGRSTVADSKTFAPTFQQCRPLARHSDRRLAAACRHDSVFAVPSHKSAFKIHGRVRLQLRSQVSTNIRLCGPALYFLRTALVCHLGDTARFLDARNWRCFGGDAHAGGPDRPP